MPAPSTKQPAVKLCLLYAPEDERHTPLLEKNLQLLQRRGLVKSWSIHDMLAGSDKVAELREQLATADLLICLVSIDFFLFCTNTTLDQALQELPHSELRIIPVLLRQIDKEDLDPPFPSLRFVPSETKALVNWGDYDIAWYRVVHDIKERVRQCISGQEQKQLMNEQQPASRYICVPMRNVYFCGREALLENIRAHLHTSQMPLLALVGTAGSGKTQVALEYVYRASTAYTTILWLRADDAEQLASSAMQAALALGLPAQDREQEQVLAALRHWFECQTNWLLVLDMVVDLPAALALLPPTYQGQVLVTMRTQPREAALPWLSVEAMELDEGALLLLRRARLVEHTAHLDQIDKQLVAQAKHVVQMTAGMPLAIEQAGASIEESALTLEEYIASYQEQRARSAMLADLAQADTSSTAVAPAITTTSALVKEQVWLISAPLLSLLKLCAFVDPDRLPLALFGETIAEAYLPNLTDQIELQAAFAILADLALVHLDTPQRLVHIPAVAQQALRNSMAEEEQRIWIRRVASLLCRAWPTELLPMHWATCQAYLPHVHSCLRWLTQRQIYDQDGLDLCLKTAIYLNLRAASSEAARLLQQALVLCNLQPDPAWQARFLHELGWSMHLQGNYTEARSYYQQALAIRERPEQDGPEGILTAQTLSKLGLLLVKQRAFADAAPLLERSLAILSAHLSIHDPLLTEPLNALAMMARQQAHYALAHSYYQRIQAIYESIDDPRGSATNLLNQATLYFMQRQYEQAAPLYRQALDIRETFLGPFHPDTANALSALATNLRLQKHLAESLDLARRALDIHVQTWGNLHVETARSLLAVGLALYGLQRYAEAEDYCLQAQAFLDTNPRPDGPALVTSSRTLAVLSRYQRRNERALAYYQYAILVSQEVYGNNHATTRNLQQQLEQFIQEQQKATDNP